jgi:hypothetical protein
MKISSYDEIECKICTQGKMTQLRSRINPVGKDGCNYALSFVDDYSCVIMIYFLKQKSDTL